jgi:hypothetical protein
MTPERPDCDWWVPSEGSTPGHRCYRQASFKWGTRFICANHAAGWLRQGKRMTRIHRDLKNPFPGNDWLWRQTT